MLRSRRIISTTLGRVCRTLATKSFVNGVDIAYERVGVGPRPILLLPGALGCSATDFAPQIKGLCRDKFTTISWDPRGYGQSIPPERDYPADFFYRDANDAVQLMKNLGFSKFSLLGWSDGANTACIIAGEYPDVVDSLVIWGGNAYVTKEELSTYESIRDISTWSERMKKPMVEIYGEEYFRKTWSAWVDAFMAIYENRGGNVCMDEVKKISAPCLIIHGVKDPMVPMFHPEYFHKNIKNSIVDYWDDGKHNLHLRFAERFNAKVEQFLINGNISSKM